MGFLDSIINGIFDAGINAQNLEYQQAANEANLAFGRESNAINYDIAMRNLGLQQQAMDINQANLLESWRREDNAVSRRVADLKAAGLNPLLAAGSAASSGMASKIEAPQINYHHERQSVDALRNTQRLNARFDLLAGLQSLDLNQAKIDNILADSLVKEQNAENLAQSNENLLLKSYNDRLSFLDTYETMITTGSVNPSSVVKTLMSIPWVKDIATDLNLESHSGLEVIRLLREQLLADYADRYKRYSDSPAIPEPKSRDWDTSNLTDIGGMLIDSSLL